DATGPGVRGCHVPAEDGEEARVLAVKPLSELPALSGRLERDPSGAAALYPLVRKIGRRGLDLHHVLDGVVEAVFELLPRATHVSVLLADEAGGERFGPVVARGRGGGSGPGAARRAGPRRVRRARAAGLAA